MRHGRVAMQINWARGFQNPMTFYQANRHIGKVTKVIGRSPAYRFHGGKQIVDKKTILFNIQQPLVFYIFLAEYIGKRRTLGTAANRGGEGFIFIKRRIKINQIHAIGVYSFQNLQIIVAKDSAVFDWPVI